jgi:transposase InsO family protein
MQVYGADKVWHQMNREGTKVARCTVERLMKRLGLHGVRRGKVVRTTVPDRAAPCPLERVNRQFKADRPNQLGCRTYPTSAPDRAGNTWPL